MVKFEGNDSLSNELYSSVNDDVLQHAFAGGGGGPAGPEGGGGHAAGEAEAAHLRHHQRPRGHRPHREAEQELHPVDVSREKIVSFGRGHKKCILFLSLIEPETFISTRDHGLPDNG